MNLPKVQRTPYSVFCGDLSGKEIHGRGHICIYVADSPCCIVTNTIQKKLYSNKIFLRLQFKENKFRTDPSENTRK